MTEEAMMREKDLPPLASLSVQAAASYATAFPKFGQPREVAHFSRDTARLVHYDRRSLQKYAPPALPARLDIGFDTYLPKASRVDEPAPIGDVLGALDRARVPVPPGTIVTFMTPLDVGEGRAHKEMSEKYDVEFLCVAGSCDVRNRAMRDFKIAA